MSWEGQELYNEHTMKKMFNFKKVHFKVFIFKMFRFKYVNLKIHIFKLFRLNFLCLKNSRRNNKETI
jgi:hypothetical protein